jgi:hypothetical protein
MAAYPGGAPNTHVASYDASNSIQIEFSRNPNDFAINQYCEIVPVDKSVDLYLKIDTDMASRLSDDGAEFVWADGDDAPTGEDGRANFNFQKFGTERRAFSFSLGSKAVDEADWDVVASHARIAAQRAMTRRTQKAVSILTDASLYDTANKGTATAVGGGKWDVGTNDAPYIQRGLQAGVIAVEIATGGVVSIDQLALVINPRLATLMAKTDEIRNYVKGSPDALSTLQGRNKAYGLPEYLYGVKLVIEKTVRNSGKKGGTQSKDYVLGATSAALVGAPKQLVGSYGVPSFSTITIFERENMTVETITDTWNRKVRGRVTDDIDVQATAPAAAFLFTAVSG